MLTAHRPRPQPRSARRLVTVAPRRATPARRTAGRAAAASTVLSLLLHAIALAVLASSVLLTPRQEQPIKVTIVGTRPDAGGGSAAPPGPPAAPAEVPKAPAPPAPVVEPARRPAVDAIKRKSVAKPKTAPAAKPAPRVAAVPPARAPAAAPNPLAAPAGGGSGAPGSGRGTGGGHGSGAGPGTGPGRGEGIAGDPNAGVIAHYLSSVRRRLEAVKRYPTLARRRGSTGTATLFIVIDRDGRPAQVQVRGSSGSELLDEEAENMVARAAPFEPLPAEVGRDRLQFTIPVRFDVDS